MTFGVESFSIAIVLTLFIGDSAPPASIKGPAETIGFSEVTPSSHIPAHITTTVEHADSETNQEKAALPQSPQGVQDVPVGPPPVPQTPVPQTPVPGPRLKQEPRKSSAKKANETWKQYVDRLVKNEYLTQNQRQDWVTGKSLTIEKPFEFLDYRQEMQKQVVPVTRMVHQIGSDGQTIQVPVTKMEVRQYLIKIPFKKTKLARLELPAPNSQPENTTNPGFVDKQGRSIHQLDVAPPPVQAKNRMITETIVFQPRKSKDESLEEYVDRLFDHGIINGPIWDSWYQGNAISMTKTVPIRMTRTEQRTRNVNVTKLVETKDETGNVRMTPKTERVDQTYNVRIQVEEPVEFNIDVPTSEEALNANWLGVQPVEKVKTSYVFAELKGFPSDPNKSFEEQQADLKSLSKKKPDENWKQYVDRLLERGLIKPSQHRKWVQGQSIVVKNRVRLVTYRQETRTRNVRIKKMVRPEGRQENDAKVAVFENVPQTYTINIPVEKYKVAALKLPRKGSRPDDEVNTGFVFRLAKRRPVPNRFVPNRN